MSYCELSHRKIQITYHEASEILFCIFLDDASHFIFLNSMGCLLSSQMVNNSCSEIQMLIDPDKKNNQVEGEPILEIKKINEQKILLLSSKSIYLLDLQLTLAKPSIRKKQKLCMNLQHHYNKMIDIQASGNQFIYGARISKVNVLYTLYDISKINEHTPIKPKIQQVYQISYQRIISLHFPFMITFTPQIIKKKPFQLQCVKYQEFKKFKTQCMRNDVSFFQAIPIDPFNNFDRATFSLIGNKMDQEKIVIWVYNFDFDYTVNIIQYSGCCLKAISHPQNSIQLLLYQQIMTESCLTNRHSNRYNHILRRIQVYYPKQLQQLYQIDHRQFLMFHKHYVVSSQTQDNKTLIIFNRIITKKMIYLDLLQRSQSIQSSKLHIQPTLYETILQLL